jgi:predicted DNA binding protein
MRRLIVELPLDELETAPDNQRLKSFQGLKSFEITHILRLEPGEFSALVRVNYGDKPGRIEDIFPSSSKAKFEHELLEENKGIHTYFIKITARPGLKRPQILSELTSGSYLSTPFEVKDGKLKVSFLGTAKQMNGVLKFLEKARIRFKVVSLIDAKFSTSSPLQRLTEKQRDVLIKAYKLGYYDRPRKISSEELAHRADLAKSTWVAHRRKAERRLLTEVLNES